MRLEMIALAPIATEILLCRFSEQKIGSAKRDELLKKQTND